jgi:ornithine carbamoyltransferase
MLPSPPLPAAAPSAHLTASEQQALISSALAIRQGALSGMPPPSLRAASLGLITETDDSPEAALFRQAAHELGARVVCIRPSVAQLAGPDAVRETARVLGRLYAAIECQGLPVSLVAQIRQHAGVPVFDGLAGAQHPSAAVVEQLGPEVDLNRRCVLQAALLGALAAA